MSSSLLAPSLATALLQTSVTEQRLVGLGYTLQLWSEFRRTSELWPNLFLNTVAVGPGAQCVAEVIQSLLDDLLVTTAAARHHLMNLRAVFNHHFGNTLIFDSDSIKVLRRALALRAIHPDFHVTAPSPAGGEQLPFTVDMLAAMREAYWVDMHIDSKMIYIACVNALFRGLRVGQVADTGKNKADHRYRIRDLSFELADASFATVLEWRTMGCPPIDTVILHCISSKTHGPLHRTKKTVPPIVLFRGEGSATEQRFFLDLIEWVTISGMSLPDDLLYARAVPHYKKLVAKDVTSAIKDIAARFGFDNTQFASRSLRLGANNEIAAQGGSDGARMAVLDHAPLGGNLLYLRFHLATPAVTTFSYDGALAASTVLQMSRYSRPR